MLNTWFAVTLIGLMTTITALSQQFSIKFQAINDGGESFDSIGSQVDEKGTVATIALLGADPSKASYTNQEGIDVPLKLLIHDPTSRFTLLELPSSARATLPVSKTRGNITSLKPLLPYFNGHIHCHHCSERTNVFDGVLNSF